MTARSMFFLAPLVFISCGLTPEQEGAKVGWSAIPNAYAKNFELQVRGEERRLVVFGPQGRTDTVGVHLYRTVQNGGEALPTPIERAVVMSTTHLPFFSALGIGDVVVGTAHADQVRDPFFSEAVRQGRVQDVSRADGVDRERMTALDPQVVFDLPFGMSDRRDVADHTVLITEYLEAHPLGRAEWIRFFGMLFGKEQRADSLFKAIEHRYTFLRGQRNLLPAPPSVLFCSHWEGTWFAPPGNSYMATLIEDAGGRYVYSDREETGNIPVPLERLLVMGDTIDHLGVLLAYPGTVDRKVLVGGDPRILVLKAVQKGAFYGNSSTSDLFGQAVLEPEQILLDLRSIFHPGSAGGRKSRYFRAIH